MPEDKTCSLKQLQPPKSSEHKTKRKKRRKKTSASSTPPENAGQRSKLRVTSKEDGEQRGGSAQRRKKYSKDSPATLSANKTISRGAELSAKESLRWEGVLEDPQAEEKRLELYRANRRQRYIAHREALLKETQGSSRQTLPKNTREEKAFAEADQQETVSLLHLSID